MEKNCSCGNSIHITLRTIIFQSKLEIENVPVYSCEQCGSNEVYPIIKEDLKSTISQYEKQEERLTVMFEEKSEIVALLMKHLEYPISMAVFRKSLDERMNELLDMLLLAQTLQDPCWTQDIHRRLAQISEIRLKPDRFAI
ncbi:hypothetical protein NV379_04125 [Paenibacillus sp. N1-5-1-14]|nr:hypothetical protein [Paenibacillus radicibacter]